LSDDERERLLLHSAFGLILVSQWMAERSDVEPEIRQRLRAHLQAIEGVLVNTGHDWIREELEQTEAKLQSQRT
jgi:hypothetical protein